MRQYRCEDHGLIAIFERLSFGIAQIQLLLCKNQGRPLRTGRKGNLAGVSQEGPERQVQHVLAQCEICDHVRLPVRAQDEAVGAGPA